MFSQFQAAHGAQQVHTGSNCPVLKNGQEFCTKGQYAGSLFTSYAPGSSYNIGVMRSIGIANNDNVARSFSNRQSSDLKKAVSAKAASSFTSMQGQTLDIMGCSRDQDCSGSKVCNLNRQDWGESFGAFAPYCTEPKYPELATGRYMRETAQRGGIGAQCTSDSNCATHKGYRCTPSSSVPGSVSQGGYCAQTFKCGSETKYLKYPYGSGVPVLPNPSDNNFGRGYATKQECSDSSDIGAATRHCKQDSSGRWFSVNPGYCPAVSETRASSALTRAHAGLLSGSVEAWNSTGDFSTSRGAGFNPMKYEASINVPKY